MKNKKVLITILIIVFVLILAGGGFAYVYFATDLLKSPKELFYTNAAKATSEVESIIKDETLTSYYEKKNNTQYINSGNISFKIENTDAQEANYNIISYTGKTDNENSQRQEEIKINYASNVQAVVKYIQDGDKYALASDEVANKYIAIENSGLSDFAKNLGFSFYQIIPDTIDFANLQITDENIKEFVNKYITIAINNIPDTAYSKSDKSIILTITPEELRNIYTSILTSLKEETIITDKLSNNGTKTYQERIDDIIDSLDQQTITDNLIITLDNYKNTTSNIKVQFEDQSETININNTQIQIISNNNNITNSITIQKTKTDDEVKYTITVSNENTDENNASAFDLTMAVDYVGLSTMSGVTENLSCEISGTQFENSGYSLIGAYVKNSVTFSNNMTIDKLTDSNSTTLNSYSSENLNSLLSALAQQVLYVNASKMVEANITLNNIPIVGGTLSSSNASNEATAAANNF